MIKAIIKPQEKYEITICGEKHEFIKESEWEGFVKFKCSKGIVIVDTGDTQTWVNQIFKDICDNKDPEEVTIIKISPALMPSGK